MIETQLHDNILEIVLSNPPVNALGERVRQGLARGRSPTRRTNPR